MRVRAASRSAAAGAAARSAALTSDTPPAVGYLDLLRGNAAYRRLWAGQVVSLLGDWFNLVATATVVQALTGSGAAVGGLFALRMLAPFLVSPLAGVVADRFDRRDVLVTADLVRAGVVACFVVVDEPGEVWLLYALTFVQLGISGFFFPAHRALLPELVSRRELGAANALGSATWSTMLALGAAAGGAVAGWVGTTACFVIDSGTFLVSAAVLAGIRRPGRDAATAGAAGAGVLHAYLDGLRYLRRSVDVALVACHKAANALLVAGAFQVVIVAISQERFVVGERGSTGLGLMLALVGVGTGLGPIAARAVTGDDDRRLRVALAASYAVTGAGVLVVALAGSLPVLLAGAALRGVGSGIGWVFSTQLLLHIVPDRVRGRVFSTEFAILTLCSSAGALLAGWAVDGVGIDGLLLTMAAAILVPGVLWGVWTRRHPRGLPAEA